MYFILFTLATSNTYSSSTTSWTKLESSNDLLQLHPHTQVFVDIQDSKYPCMAKITCNVM